MLAQPVTVRHFFVTSGFNTTCMPASCQTHGNLELVHTIRASRCSLRPRSHVCVCVLLLKKKKQQQQQQPDPFGLQRWRETGNQHLAEVAQIQLPQPAHSTGTAAMMERCTHGTR